MVLSPSFLIFNQECRKVPCTFPRLHGCRMLEQWTCRFCLRFSIDWQISELFCCMISTSSLILNIYLINITAHFLETKKTCSFQIPTKKHLPNHPNAIQRFNPPWAPALHSPNPLHCARVDAPNPAPLRWNGPAAAVKRGDFQFSKPRNRYVCEKKTGK